MPKNDRPASSGVEGAPILAIRKDSLTALADTDHDYSFVQVDSNGALVSSLSTGTGAISPSNPFPVTLPNGASDPFGRFRTSSPYTLYDGKLLYDNQPLFWDDEETSGSGTSSTLNTNQSSVTLSVGATTAGTRVRQTFERFNYQPGKGQLIFMTGVIGAGGSGITKRVGYMDDNNGLFVSQINGTVGIGVRTFTSGSAVDTVVDQDSWNLDVMDGTGTSGITLDVTKTQIFVIDFEWLGVGRVRFGINIDGITYYVHEVLNANNLTTVYMQIPCLPIRYEISNDGTGAASSLTQICASVQSEGGLELTGSSRYLSTDGAISVTSTANTYAMLGVRLKSTHLGTTVQAIKAAIFSSGNDDFEWFVLFNPTVAGTFTYSDETNSSIQLAIGSGNANTITGGTRLFGGFGEAGSASATNLDNPLRLGAAIDGTRDELVLAVNPLSANATFRAGLEVRELL